MARTMTPEQRAAKNARDRERRAQRAAGTSISGRERAPSGPTRRKPSRAELRKQVESVLTLVNLGAAGILPSTYRPDLLDPAETHILAEAVAAELEANPKLLAYVQRMASTSGPHMVLLAALCVIAAPRLARRNMLPIPLAQAVMLAGNTLVSGSATRGDMEWTSANSAENGKRKSGTTTTASEWSEGAFADGAISGSESWETPPNRSAER